uniref:Uncharacterized protein LOC104211769 n=1 Tax=Nicotiana sylvestris TaxID=4096 RepID=A0A1U7USZ0_NICSY|nr:PREDICTED: uncharacterized protein LOC104211769 [Nicotiana sylvestris]
MRSIYIRVIGGNFQLDSIPGKRSVEDAAVLFQSSELDSISISKVCFAFFWSDFLNFTISYSYEQLTIARTKLSLKKQKEDNGSGGAKSELDKYISEEQEPFSEEFDILSWWKTHAPRFPILSELARDVLAIPISSVASECAFSTGGRILDSFRSSLTTKCVQALICVQDWIREEKNPISVEEDLKYLEELELDMENNGSTTSIV